MDNITYGVAFLVRKTSLGLEEVRRMEPTQFKELLEEVYFQESQDDYQTANYVANILAAIANTVPRKSRRTYKASDFINIKPPRRIGQKDAPGSKEELEALAKRFGIKLPSREMIDI